jgi:Lon-like ATP-dependent protease
MLTIAIRAKQSHRFLRLRPHKNLNAVADLPRRAISIFAGTDESEKDNSESDNDVYPRSRSLVSHGGDSSPTPNPIMILPISRKPLFPGFISTLTIRNEATIDAIQKTAETAGGFLGVFYRSDLSNGSIGPSPESLEFITNASQLSKVGTFAQIQSITRIESSANILLLGHRRLSIQSISSLGPPTIANVLHWKKPTLSTPSTSLKAYMNEVIASLRELLKLSPLLQEQVIRSSA